MNSDWPKAAVFIALFVTIAAYIWPSPKSSQCDVLSLLIAENERLKRDLINRIGQAK